MTLTEELKQYCRDTLNDKPRSCKKHKWACQRFLDDLKKSASKKSKKKFPYQFDERKAQRYLDFMALFKHNEGVLAGKYIEPHISQKFIYGNIYGWYHIETGYRRFTKAYIQKARKNAKSQELALVGKYETFMFDETRTEKMQTFVGATKKDQSCIVYDMACEMLEGSDFFTSEENKDKWKISRGRITYNETNSFMRPLNKEDKKKGDGLNIQCAIIDEYHAHETSEIYDVLDSGTGSRSQPLLITITTAGFDLNAPCYNVEYSLCKKILDPDIPIELDNYFVMINELERDEEGHILDDVTDERNWTKANPIVCSYSEGIEGLRKAAEEAAIEPEKMRNFLTKRMNVWIQDRAQGYMNMTKWALCGVSKKKPFPTLDGLQTIVGFDLSSRIDLCSLGFECAVNDDGLIAAVSHSFMPEEMVRTKEARDRMPYGQWINDGWITATPGSEVDYHFILEYLEKIYDKNKWRTGEACFDKALATWLTHEVTEMGFTAVEIPQSYSMLSEPTKDFRGKVYNKKIIHEKNPVLTWAVSNAVTRIGPSGNILLDKSKSIMRIDPVAALINAHSRMMAIDKVSPYEKRGLREL